MLCLRLWLIDLLWAQIFSQNIQSEAWVSWGGQCLAVREQQSLECSVAGMGEEAVRVDSAWNGPSVGEQGRKDGDTSILSSPHWARLMNFIRENIHQTPPENVQTNSQSEVNTAWSGYFASKWPDLRKITRYPGLNIFDSIESVEIKMADCRHSGPFQNAFHEGLTVWSPRPCSLGLPRLAGLHITWLKWNSFPPRCCIKSKWK